MSYKQVNWNQMNEMLNNSAFNNTEQTKLQQQQPPPPTFNYNNNQIQDRGLKCIIQKDQQDHYYQLQQLQLDKVMPRKQTDPPTKYLCCKDVCKNIPTGYHFCTKTTFFDEKEHDMSQFGTGLILYFRFIKYLANMFLFFSLITFISLSFYITNAKENNYFQNFDINTWIMSTTLASLDNQRCDMNLYNSENTDLVLRCKYGQLDNTKVKIGIYPGGTDMNCGTLPDYEVNYNCMGNESMENLLSGCNNKDECHISINQSYFNQNCGNFQGKYVLIRTVCYQTQIDIYPSSPININTVAMLIPILDTFMIFCFFIFIMLLEQSENSYIHQRMLKHPEIQDFSIQLSHLVFAQSNVELKMAIWKHLNTYFLYYQNKFKINIEIQIIDICLAQSQETIYYNKRIDDLDDKICSLFLQFIDNYQLEQQHMLHGQDLVNRNDTNAMKTTILAILELQIKNWELIDKQAVSEKYNKGIRYLFDLDKLLVQKAKLTTLKQFAEIHQQAKPKYAWAIFQTIEQRDLAMKALKTDFLERMSEKCCSNQNLNSKKIFKFREVSTLLEVHSAPSPDTIIWENLYMSHKQKMIRNCISFIITLGLIIICYVVVVLVQQNKQDQLKQYPSVNCSNMLFQNITQDKVIWDSEQHQSVGYVACYCQQNALGLIGKITNTKVYNICKNWWGHQAYLNFIQFMAVFVVVVLNKTIEYFLRYLSRFEKHNYLSQEYVSRIKKTFGALVLSTGIIIVVQNINFGIQQSSQWYTIFPGQQQDFTMDWFKNVGSMIVIIFLMTIFSEPTLELIMVLFACLKQFRDRGYSKDMKKTKKVQLYEWVDLYKGPEFNIDLRYAQILSFIFVCLLFCSGVPILIPITMIILFEMYWIDKIKLFILCQKPVAFDESLSKPARTILKIAAFIHLPISIFVFGNTSFFYTNAQQISTPSILGTNTNTAYVATFITRMFQSKQNYLAAILILVILFFAFLFLLIKITSKCFVCCYKIQQKIEGKTKLQESIEVKKKHIFSVQPKQAIMNNINNLEQEKERLQQNQEKMKSEGLDQVYLDYENILESMIQQYKNDIKKLQRNEKEDPDTSTDCQMNQLCSYYIEDNLKYSALIKPKVKKVITMEDIIIEEKIIKEGN